MVGRVHTDAALVLNVYGGVFDDESTAVMDRLTSYARRDGSNRRLIRVRD